MPPTATRGPLAKPWRRRGAPGSTVLPTPAAPATPNTPYPADTATALYSLLSWVSAGATKFDLYFGTAVSPPLLIPKYVGTSYVPTLLPSTTYYWQVVAFNDGGSATGPVWSFTTPSASAVLFLVNGVLMTSRIRFPGGLSIRDVLGAAPNTAQALFDTVPPSGGQAVTIGLGLLDADRLLFGGEIQFIDRSYELKPNNVVWPASLVDHTFYLNERRPFGTFVNQSATTIAQTLIAQYAPDFSAAGVQAALPAVSINFDGQDDFMSCMNKLAVLINGRTKVDYSRVVKLFTTADTDDPPDPLDATHLPLNNPPLRFSTDLSQVRTRVFGKGHNETIPTDVAERETILPLPDASQFNPAGGQIVAGSTPDGAQTDIYPYTGVHLGGGGALVGPGAVPSTAPSVAPAVGAGLSIGVFKYAYTYVTGSGESLPSPLATITTATELLATTAAARPAPGSAPSVSESATLDSFSGGNYQFRTTFIYSDGTESLYSTTGTVALSGTKQPTFTGIPLGDTRVTKRRIYVSFSAAGTPDWSASSTNRWVEINDNSTTTQTAGSGGGTSPASAPPSSEAGYPSGSAYLYVADTSAFSSSGGSARIGASTFTYTGRSTTSSVGALTGMSGLSVAVSVDDAVYTVGPYTQASLAGIAVGPSGTTQRNVYRTGVNGTQLKLQQNIANNTATVGAQDATPDASLGANAPVADTSGLTAATGQVLAGSASLRVSSAAPFPASGGWVALSGSQTIRYTNLGGTTAPATALTLTPQAGAGVTDGVHRYAFTWTTGGGVGVSESMLSPATSITVGGGNNQIALTNIALGPTGTIWRNVYRTKANGDAQFYYIGTLGDNVSTSGFLDVLPDSSLVAPASNIDTSNLSGTSLLGIPASGPGAIQTTVTYGSPVLPSPALTGLNNSNGLTRAIAKGSQVHVWVQRDDLAAQAALSQLERKPDGTARRGIREYIITDDRRSEASLIALCDAELARLSRPIVSVTYATRDPKTRAGKTVSINLSTYTFDPNTFDSATFDTSDPWDVVGDFLIQDVTITFDPAPSLLPRYTVNASSSVFSLADLLRRVQVT